MKHDSLSRSQLRYLRALAHKLKPVVMIGAKGLTEALLKEAEVALNAHQLIKVRVAGDDRGQRAELVDKLLEQTAASHVSTIGKVATLYRANPDRDPIKLPRD